MIVNTAADALVRLMSFSGRTYTSVSESLGHKSNYINVFVSKNHDVRTSTMARIARECGYTLALVPDDRDGETIEILPE